MRLGLQQVQDMLELGLIGIEDIRKALISDKQARATIEAEKAGPCSCREETKDRALYECKSCLLDALNSPISDDEIHYNEVCTRATLVGFRSTSFIRDTSAPLLLRNPYRIRRSPRVFTVVIAIMSVPRKLPTAVNYIDLHSPAG
jgi:hypothetical protein